MTVERAIRTVDGGRIAIPETATRSEAAAIAAAVSSQLSDREAAQATTEEEPTWDGKRFAFTGRIEALTGETHRVPGNAPTDDWTAAGRTDRF